MKTLTAKDAKYGLSRLIRPGAGRLWSSPSTGRPVVVVLAVEEFEQLKAMAATSAAAHERHNKKARE